MSEENQEVMESQQGSEEGQTMETTEVTAEQVDETANEGQETKESGKKENKVVEFIKELAIYCLIFIAVLYLVPNYVCARTVVDGPSMKNTLHNRDSVLLDKLSYHIVEPKRFDVIVFYHFMDPENPDKKDKDAYEFYVKRIIGLPGETVQIVGDEIYINGELLEENYGKDPITDEGRATEPIVLGEDEYFVLGDNREVSVDSRYESVGNIKKDWIVGKVRVRVYPFDSMGIIK